MILGFKDYLKTKEVKFSEGQRLSELSPIKIGGKAGLVVSPVNKLELLSVLDYLESYSVDYRVVGGGSNILFPDNGTDTVIIRTTLFSGSEIDGYVATVNSGVSLAALSKQLARRRLSGAEELSGIPGTLGGAVVGNAGAYGRETRELLISAELYDRELGRVVELSREELGFGYRTSILKSGKYVVLSVKLRLKEAHSDTALERIAELTEKRRKSQPHEPSLGSTFKRPEGGYASRMIDLCGLKGRSIGGARVSERHAGFIVNGGGATAEDYLSLAELVRFEVERVFGVHLEYEINIFR